MGRCLAEICQRWGGDGCNCQLFDLDPAPVVLDSPGEYELPDYESIDGKWPVKPHDPAARAAVMPETRSSVPSPTSVHMYALNDQQWSPYCTDEPGWTAPLASVADQVTCTDCMLLMSPTSDKGGSHA